MEYFRKKNSVGQASSPDQNRSALEVKFKHYDTLILHVSPPPGSPSSNTTTSRSTLATLNLAPISSSIRSALTLLMPLIGRDPETYLYPAFAEAECWKLSYALANFLPTTLFPEMLDVIWGLQTKFPSSAPSSSSTVDLRNPTRAEDYSPTQLNAAMVYTSTQLKRARRAWALARTRVAALIASVPENENRDLLVLEHLLKQVDSGPRNSFLHLQEKLEEREDWKAVYEELEARKKAMTVVFHSLSMEGLVEEENGFDPVGVVHRPSCANEVETDAVKLLKRIRDVDREMSGRLSRSLNWVNIRSRKDSSQTGRT